MSTMIQGAANPIDPWSLHAPPSLLAMTMKLGVRLPREQTTLFDGTKSSQIKGDDLCLSPGYMVESSCYLNSCRHPWLSCFGVLGLWRTTNLFDDGSLGFCGSFIMSALLNNEH